MRLEKVLGPGDFGAHLEDVRTVCLGIYPGTDQLKFYLTLTDARELLRKLLVLFESLMGAGVIKDEFLDEVLRQFAAERKMDRKKAWEEAREEALSLQKERGSHVRADG
jgi:hypothetical protein